jgi:hypothetical protein
MYPRRCGTGTTACETLDAALCGTDSGAYPRRRARDIEFCVGLSHSRGSEGELREAIGTPNRSPIEPMRGVKFRRLTGNPHGVALCRERPDRGAGSIACDQATPSRLNIRAERGHRTEPGDDNSALLLA